MAKAKCVRCGASAISDTFEQARKKLNHAIGLSRGIKCGDSYNSVCEIKDELKPRIQKVITKTKTPPEKPIVESIVEPKIEPTIQQAKEPKIESSDTSEIEKPKKSKPKKE